MTLQTISADEAYLIETKCPVCGQKDLVKAIIQSHLSTTAEGGYIGVKLKQAKPEHDCNQQRVTFLAEDVTDSPDHTISLFRDSAGAE